MKRLVASALVLALLSACAGATYRPLVDRPGPQFEQDLAECQRYAEGEANAAAGAAIGALLGALLGLAAGHKTGYQSDFARAGAIGGALGGSVSAERNQQTVIANCLRGRGYSVLR
ncbi:MAG: glycine zipper family protein [Rhodocyclaceae bacterium]|nr:glycine zipper family protein [Rhodocyclaceae bacterium]